MYIRTRARTFFCVPLYKRTGGDFFPIYLYTGVHIIRAKSSLLRVKDPEKVVFLFILTQTRSDPPQDGIFLPKTGDLFWQS